MFDNLTSTPSFTGTEDLQAAYLNELSNDRRNDELTRIGNSFERISEQLGILHDNSAHTLSNERANYHG